MSSQNTNSPGLWLSAEKEPRKKPDREMIPTRLVYAMSQEGPFSRDFSFRDQLRRAVVSIMNNIAEGFERGGNKEFVRGDHLQRPQGGDGGSGSSASAGVRDVVPAG